MLLGSRNDSTNGQTRTLLQTALGTRSRCLNRADWPSPLEEGMPRLERGALHYSGSLFLPPRQDLKNVLDYFSDPLRLLIASEIPPYREGKCCFQELTRNEWQSGDWNSGPFLWVLSASLSPAPPRLSSWWGDVTMLPKSEGAPWQLMPRVLAAGCFSS